MRTLLVGFGVVGVALLGWGLRVGTVHAAPDEAATPQFYATRVQPILKEHCYRCHGGMNHRGGLNLATRAGMMKGGHDGPVVVAGDPAKSLLVRLIRHEGPANDPMPMPPKLPEISGADIATVTRWVKAGAIMPDDVPRR
ncbi:MAG TPA: c-type cytochrome domain-containing protein [Edaphobacter sp.]|uniref:c-type cytochrome domain-containing protein n=1 Tax=Edaphobacter sp. TaxID=1934404 RepID=UPI002BBFD44E|nr:c-type cytochrome domain-containing protein [Edaphobacter sp.]HUZ97200.1 c-type cytochrome domain-containing protein [Edaphobacter sp.]